MLTENSTRLIITIDGPAGAGKSTVAKRLAARLHYWYLDTGALYRAVAWKVMTAGVDPRDRAGVARLLPTTQVSMTPGTPGGPDGDRVRVSVDGRDVSEEIRQPDVSRLASHISAIPAVRDWLLPLQQKIGAEGGIVAEGRDLGTRVFPQAHVKFFLDADLGVRAQRRNQELAAAGHRTPIEETRADLRARDERDRSRDIAPLAVAPGARIIDSSTLNVEQVVEEMMRMIGAAW